MARLTEMPRRPALLITSATSTAVAFQGTVPRSTTLSPSCNCSRKLPPVPVVESRADPAGTVETAIVPPKSCVESAVGTGASGSVTATNRASVSIASMGSRIPAAVSIVCDWSKRIGGALVPAVARSW